MAKSAHFSYQLRYKDGIGRVVCECGEFRAGLASIASRNLVLEHLRRVHEIHRTAAELVDAFPQFPSHKDEV